MSMDEVIKQFKKAVCAEIEVELDKEDRYIVHTPFTFDDGDELPIFLLKEDDGSWILSDEGMSYMVLSYEKINIDSKGRASIIQRVKKLEGIEDRDGELILRVEDGKYGEALYSFIQALIRIGDIAYTKTERVRSIFMDEFKVMVRQLAPSEKIHFDYSDPELDPKKEYPVDCMVEVGPNPFFIYAISNDEKCLEATVSLMHYEQQGKKFHSVAVFDDMEDIKPKNYAKLAKVCERQLPTLQDGRERLQKYVEEHSVLA